MSSTPQYTSLVVTAGILISAANTNRDGTGTIVDLAVLRTQAANGFGGRIDTIKLVGIGTTTAGMLRIYRKAVAGTYKLIREIPVAAITPSGTVKAFTIPASEGADVNGTLILGELLAAGEGIGVSTHNAESFHGSANGGEF